MGGNPSPVIDPAAVGSPRVAVAARRVRHAIGLAIALLCLWFVWQGYRNPDFLLGLAAFRLC